MKGLLHFLVVKIILVAFASSFVSCYDPSSLQDYCVAVNDENGVYVNGKFCKDPKKVTVDDFYTSGLNIPGNTSNRFGSAFTDVDVQRIPGLNTLAVSLSRADIAPGGRFAPHIHPRSSQIIVVIKGKLLVGFVSSDEDNNRLFSKVLYPGDAFVIPIGLVHFGMNIGKTNVVAFTAAGSQNPGLITVADTVFGSTPLIGPEILAQSFAMDVDTVRYLQTVFPFKEDPTSL